MRGLLLLAALVLAGCSGGVRPKVAEPVARWQAIATQADRSRLHDWREALVAGLAQARTDGHGALIATEGALLQPDAVIEPVALPAGGYRCRVIKLGAAYGSPRTFTASPRFECRVNNEGEVQSFNKMAGPQRPMGFVFDDGPLRKVFLGTMMLTDEARPFDYGTDPDRDIAGVVQRIGATRWRLVVPYPRFESTVDIIELVPVQP